MKYDQLREGQEAAATASQTDQPGLHGPDSAAMWVTPHAGVDTLEPASQAWGEHDIMDNDAADMAAPDVSSNARAEAALLRRRAELFGVPISESRALRAGQIMIGDVVVDPDNSMRAPKSDSSHDDGDADFGLDEPESDADNFTFAEDAEPEPGPPSTDITTPPVKPPGDKGTEALSDDPGDERPEERAGHDSARFRRSTDLEPPENIGSLLETALVPSDLPDGDTQKFYIKGHPDLLVRVSETADPDREYTADELQAEKEIGDRLTHYGVNVLPSCVVEQGGKAYVVTQRVTGVELETALSSESSAELLAAVDRTWSGLCDNLVDSLTSDRPIPGDATTAYQYMYGTIAGEPEPNLWLVDLPRDHLRLRREDEYELELLEIADEVADIEQRTGQPLPGARSSIERALEIAQDSTQYGDGIINAVRQALDQGVRIYPGEDDRIHGLRTR